MKYDYLIVGGGLFGAVAAYRIKQAGKTCLLIERRSHLGGNTYCEFTNGIVVHKYGAHIFHTNKEYIWRFVNSFVDLVPFVHTPMANYKGTLYNLPFNLNTFNQLWGVTNAQQASAKIEEQKSLAIKKMQSEGVLNPRNLEEQALSLVGNDIYHIFIKNYSEKQWGRKCTTLSPTILMRIPFRMTFDNNYFNDKYQGVPIGGYNKLIENLLDGVTVKTETNYFNNRDYWNNVANQIVFSGQLDEFYNFCYGPLEYRTIRFQEEHLKIQCFQGCAVINYTDAETPYTRIIEHKYLPGGLDGVTSALYTVITKEYPEEYSNNAEPLYPINDQRNNYLYKKYAMLANKETNVIFGGRLADYKYYDMDQVIERALTADLHL